MQLAPRILVLALALAACGKTDSPPITENTPAATPPAPPPAPEAPKVEAKADAKSEAKAEEAKAEAEAPPTAAETPPPVSFPPGPAYFAVNKRGVVRLDGGTFTPLKNAPDSLIKKLHLAHDGALWVIGFDDILKLEGDSFKSIARAGFQETGGVDDFFVVSETDIWAAGFGGVSHWDGKGWTKEEKAVVGAGNDILSGIAVDREGKVWVASTNAVHVKASGAWSTVDLGTAGRNKLFFESVERAGDGTVYALASAALLKLGPATTEVQTVPLGVPGFPSFDDLALGPDGSIAVRNLFDVIYTPPGGAKPKVWKKKDFLAEAIRALAVDASGRVWVGSEIGVAVLGPGDTKLEWSSGAVPELAGEIVGVAVAGAGPETLPAAGPVRTGGLKGKLLRDGAPAVDVEVELCPSPAMMFTKSPCSDSAVHFNGKTDAQGEWHFKEVPLGAYGLAIKQGDKWSITLGSDMGMDMKEGQVYDTGSRSLDKK